MASFDKPMLGTVLLIEQDVPRDTIHCDLENIAALGMNLVVLWPPMSRWDSADGVSAAFDTVDFAMDTCAELGLGVILELEGQNPSFQFMPDYQFKEEYFSTDDTGKHWVNYLHPEVDRLICDYCRDVAVHFRDHPALLGYDLFNEVNFRSTDKYNLAAFQSWLENKYESVAGLNRVWGRFYNSFDQVRIDNLDYAYSSWSSLRPQLDFFDYRADTVAGLIRHWGEAVREVDPQHALLADSSWSMTYFDNFRLGNDDWKAARSVDVFGLSVYPQSWDIHIASDPCPIAQIFNGGRAAAPEGVPVMVSELQTHNQTALAQNSSVFDEIKLWTWQAFIHGIGGLVYWKWRPFRRGFQVTGRGMCSQDGSPNERANGAKEVAEVLNAHPKIFDSRRVLDNGVGIIYSADTDSFTDLILPDEPGGFYRACFAGWYSLLFELGITPTVIRPQDVGEARFSHLKLIIAPSLAVLADNEAEKLADFIDGGGRVVADGRLAIVDEHLLARERPPGQLGERFGYRELDYLSPYVDKQVSIAGRFCKIENTHSRTHGNSSSGDPMSAITDNTLYLPVFLGHDIHNPAFGELARNFVLDSLDLNCRVLEKVAETDVTVSKGTGTLVAGVNYGTQPNSVRVLVDTTSPCRMIAGTAEHKIERGNNSTTITITIPPRDIFGLLFE
jgi:beta-galactosidase GanA